MELPNKNGLVMTKREKINQELTDRVDIEVKQAEGKKKKRKKIGERFLGSGSAVNTPTWFT